MRKASGIFIAFLCVASMTTNAFAREDLRVYQHGIDILEKPDGSLVVVWSSAGNPPVDDWIHDIYTSTLDRDNPVIRPVRLLGNEEAQEPASSAINTAGTILVTMEDGWNAENEIAQRYGVYTSSLGAVRPYPQLILDGGHSGHVAAVGSRFVVFYSEGWVDGGGVDDLGSGDDVYAAIVSGNGSSEGTVRVAVGDSRDWWPLVAGSPTRATLVWQRFVEGETHANVMIAVLDPLAGRLVAEPRVLARGVTYYTYDVEYVPALNRFLTLVSYVGGGGGAYLTNENGVVTASVSGLPAIVREGQPAVRQEEGSATVVYPRAGGGVAVLALTKDTITLVGTKNDSYAWQYMGTAGVFLDATRAYFASLSTKGVVGRTFTIDAPSTDEPGPAEPAVEPPSPPQVPPSMPIDILFATTTADTRDEVPHQSDEVSDSCAGVFPFGRLSFAYYFVEPYRLFTPSAHLLLAQHCAR